MKGQEHLNKPEQFAIVYNKGSSFADRLMVLKAMPNGLEFSRYGISVSKRVGNAVVRNRLKRLLREILRVTSLRPGWDIILIVRGTAAASDYHKLKLSVEGLLSRAHMLAR